MDGFPPNFAQLYIKVVDLITRDKFFSDRLRNVDSVELKNGGLPLTKQWLLTQGCATAPPVIRHSAKSGDLTHFFQVHRISVHVEPSPTLQCAWPISLFRRFGLRIKNLSLYGTGFVKISKTCHSVYREIHGYFYSVGQKLHDLYIRPEGDLVTCQRRVATRNKACLAKCHGGKRLTMGDISRSQGEYRLKTCSDGHLSDVGYLTRGGDSFLISCTCVRFIMIITCLGYNNL